jgi:hypothetical protein
LVVGDALAHDDGAGVGLDGPSVVGEVGGVLLQGESTDGVEGLDELVSVVEERMLVGRREVAMCCGNLQCGTSVVA